MVKKDKNQEFWFPIACCMCVDLDQFKMRGIIETKIERTDNAMQLSTE